MNQPHDPRPAPVYGQEGAYATHSPTGGHVPADQVPAVQPPPAPPSFDRPPAGYPQADVPPGGHAATGPGAPVGPYPRAGAPYLPRNDLAVWSLVLGLLGVMGCVFFTGVPAVVLGGKARRAVAAGEADNDGMAVAGIVLGWVATGLGALLVALVFLAVLLPLVFVGLAVPFLDMAP